MNDKIKRAAEAEGYELAYGEESYGKHFLGLQIFVKMSERKLCGDDTYTFYESSNLIKKGLDAVSAKLDPEGPAMRERYRSEIASIYQKAGVQAIYMEAIPNGYCNEPCCLNKPWFRVTSTIGHVVIGWRKSVMSIDWKDSVIKASEEDLFPDNKVTRGETSIHAHGTDKAVEYIRRLHQHQGG